MLQCQQQSNKSEQSCMQSSLQHCFQMHTLPCIEPDACKPGPYLTALLPSLALSGNMMLPFIVRSTCEKGMPHLHCPVNQCKLVVH